MGALMSAIVPQNTYQVPVSGTLNAANLQAQQQNAYTSGQANLAQQNALANALLAQSQGQGPNIAQQALQQNTAQGIRQQQGLMASQKGINPALAARQAALGGAEMQQQAAGQGALMQAQQQLAAQQAYQQQLGSIAGQNLDIYRTAGGLANQAVLGAQGINAGIASQNAQNNTAAMMGLLGGAAQLGSAGIIGSSMGGGGGSMAGGSSTAALADGGMVPHYAKGGMAKLPSHLGHIASIYHGYSEGGVTQLKDKGGHVPGKPKVSGDSPKNDVVPAMLSPGEIVLPRTVVNAEEPEKEAAQFVAEELKKKGKYKGNVEDDFKKALKDAVEKRKAK
jgi:hypothetical protein